MEYLPAIISAIGTIVAAWFAYNQYSKNKLTDLKIERFRLEEQISGKRRSDSSSVVFGELWNVLYQLEADRVYIVQSHQSAEEEVLSVSFEVKRKGFLSIKDNISGLKMSDIPGFSSSMRKNLLLHITEVDMQVEDELMKAILSLSGSDSLVVRRLSDSRHDWLGSIFCEFTRPVSLDDENVRSVLDEAAMNIRYILPDCR